jgi:hypothetical protein
MNEFNMSTLFDWNSLSDAAGNFAIEVAKSEAKNIADKSIDEIKDKWRKIDWPGRQKKYKDNLLENISTTKVLGNPKPIFIENIYTDCYVYDRLSALRRFSGDLDKNEDLEILNQDLGERLSAIDVAKTGENLFILGKPGAGKTTFLKYLAMLCCKGRIRKTPIFISLKEWSDSSLSIIPYIAKQFDICGLPNAESFVKALLEKGEALVLLDGLDEVNEASNKRSQTIKEIVSLSKQYKKCQYCTTCRTAATDYSFEKFTYLEVADFDDSQQLKFIEQWHGSNNDKLKLFLSGWNDSQQDGLRELGKTPLLLTLLCLAFEENLGFPARQVDLYKDALDALLRKWDTSRLIGRDTFYKNLSFSRRENLLESIAAKFYFDSRTAFRKNEAEKAILEYLSQLPDKEKSADADAGLVLRQIEAQHGLIVERAVGIYTFSHLTLQEYFTASHIVKSHDERLLDNLVSAALQDQKWREVILYTVGLLPSADPILKRMAAQLHDLRGTQTGVIRFLSFCLCDALEKATEDSGKEFRRNGFTATELKTKILLKVADQRPPPLTASETAKIAEHLVKIKTFLSSKAQKYDFGIAAEIINSAADIISNRPSRAASLLGSYFFKPEDFTAYLYACRLMIECLEVAVSKHRNGYIESVMSVGESDIKIAIT